MSREELRAQQERLIAQVAHVLEQMPPLQAQNAELVQALQALHQEYDRKLAEAEAQIAELKRELFGPKAERLTREQQEQFDQLVKDMEAQNQQPAPESDEILSDQEAAEGSKKQRRPRVRHPLPRRRRSPLSRNCSPVPAAERCLLRWAKRLPRRST